MLLIYTPISTPRLQYIFEFIFKDILGLEYKLTKEQEEFKNYTGAKFSYSKQPLDNELFFSAGKLLFEKGIIEQEINVFDWKDTKVFFATSNKHLFPFDPFAASFYLLSRYEEYLPHIRDEHERFLPKESLAYKNNFLDKPVINSWAKKIKETILEKYPDVVFAQRSYQFISTIDIDNAYAYLEKGFMRTMGAYARSLLHLNFKEIKERTNVLLGFQKDPYDSYKYQLDLNKTYQFKSIYFFLVGDYGENDKNISINNRKFQSLIKSIADYAQVGIHPSYGSNKDPIRIKKELSRLSKVLKRDVFSSRQHFLKLLLPLTYRRLIDLDIKEDYTMGYASEPGFRASTCTPFYFYDLDTEVTTNLKVYSFAVMDSCLKYYLKIQPEQAIDKIKPLIEEIKKVDGTFISLWHNESLGDSNQWRGWKFVYEELIKEALININAS